MQRKLIPNVPEIPYDGNNAAFFITLLEATLKGLGEDCDKAKLIALSAMARSCQATARRSKRFWRGAGIIAAPA